MSRPPYNFADERPQSPFDRPTQQSPSGQPPSFKTNVNRNKTRKWAEAKQHNYDGDEWGGFDPYDEYGNYDDPAGPSKPSAQKSHMRQHSFDKGEERRAFSAGMAPSGQQQRGYAPSQQPYADRPRTASQDGSSTGSRREFSQPAYAPAPLKSSQSPGSRGPPGGPPRKSSISQAGSGLIADENDQGNSGKPAAAIPFIRPSDIYKRMAEEKERERQSMDSSRPSIDSSTSTKPTVDHPASVGDTFGGDKAAPLLPDPVSSDVPRVTAMQSAQPRTLEAPTDMPTSSIDGFQSIVDRAFDRPDDNSVPPTPIITNSQSINKDLSRSNTDSTSGISPIMSRVPSSGTEESRGRAAASNRERAMSEITEEAPLEPPPKSTSRQTTPTQATGSRPGSVENFIPGHTRKVSTPSPHASPARSPRIQTGDRRLSQPLAAEVAQGDNNEPASATSEYSKSTYPTSATSDRSFSAFGQTPITATEKAPPADNSVTPRLGSRSSTPVASPVDGRRSPFPGGRVRDLAGKYNEIDSRRNSQTSLKSKESGSFSSWSRSDDAGAKRSTTGSGQASPDQATSPLASPSGTLERPRFDTQPSFRPHLPGEWVSTTDLHRRPSEDATGPALGSLEAPSEDKNFPKTPTSTEKADIDLTPKANEFTRSPGANKGSSGPVDALKAAGAALAASLAASTSTSHTTRDFASPAKEEAAPASGDTPKRSIGDVYMRPLEFQHTASSVASSEVPTPAAKETSSAQPFASKHTYFSGHKPERDSWEGSVASDEAEDVDTSESDALRREIVRSLTPQAQERVTEQRSRDSEDSSAIILPRVQGSQPGKGSPLRTAENTSNLPPLAELEGAGPIPANGPGLLNKRFSWESKPVSTFNASNLASEVDLPHSNLEVVNPDSAPNNETGAIFSDGTTRNRQVSGASSASNNLESGPDFSDETIGNRQISGASLSSDLPGSRSPPLPATVVSAPKVVSVEQPSSPIPERTTTLSAETPSTEAGVSSGPQASAPEVPEKSAKIASFREIANIKSSLERIEKYNSTRKQFADMNTGLQSWLATTIAANPDLGSLTSINDNLAPAGPAPGSTRHRQAPSIIKMAKGLGTKGDGPAPQSVDGQTVQPSRRTSNTFSSHSPQASVNTEKMQAMGKDLLSSAGKLGGKGMAGAKGWLAKGKQRLRDSSGGGDKTPDISRSGTPTSFATSTENTRASSPGLSDAQSTARPRLHKRSNTSTSSKHPSLSFDRFRSDRSDKSRSRSRPRSLILPSRSGTPMLDFADAKIVEESPRDAPFDGHGKQQTDEYVKGQAEKHEQANKDPGRGALAAGADVRQRPGGDPASSDWAADWEKPGLVSPLISPFNDPGFRLGVLPSPMNETFAPSVRESQDGDADISPIKSACGSPSKTGSGFPLKDGRGNLPFDRTSRAAVEGGGDPARFSSGEGRDRSLIYAPRAKHASMELPVEAGAEKETAYHQSGQRYQTEPVELPADTAVSQKPSSQAVVTSTSDQSNESIEDRALPDEQDKLIQGDECRYPSADISFGVPVQEDDLNPNGSTEKRDTPMIASPQFRLNDARSQFGSDYERKDWTGVKPRLSRSQLSIAESSKRSSGIAVSTGLNSVPSDLSLVSAGTVEKPSQVAIVRVGSPKLVNNRSSLPSQSRQSSYAAPPATPSRELDRLKFVKRNTDSPTLPEHLTPRSITFPQEMYDSDSTPFTTPGDEERRLEEDSLQTPRAPIVPMGYQDIEPPHVNVESDQQAVDVATLSARPGAKVSPERSPFGPEAMDLPPGLDRMPLVAPEQKRFGIVAADAPNASIVGTPKRIAPSTQDYVWGQGSDMRALSRDRSVPPSREFTPPPQSYGPSEYRRTPPRRSSASGNPRWSQYQTQLDQETRFDKYYNAPPQYQRQGDAPAVTDQQDSYHRDYMDDRLVEMSPMEASMIDREDAFKQATERQRQHQHVPSSRMHSRTPSLGPTPVNVPPSSSHQTEQPPPGSFRRSSSRLLGALDRPLSATSSSLANNRMSHMTSTMDLDALDSNSKGKLVKKDRRASVQRAASTASPTLPKEKKKRFSGLGSFFGRSKSNAAEPAAPASPAVSKRNRLSKQGPMIVSAPRQMVADTTVPIEEFESPRKEQATLADDNLHPRSMTPLSRRNSGIVTSDPSRSNTMASRNSFYGPPDKTMEPQPTLPNVQFTTRRLHSERPGKRFSYVDVPEEFQPVDTSYRAGISPIDPPRLSQVYEQTVPQAKMLRSIPDTGMGSIQNHNHPSSRFPTESLPRALSDGMHGSSGGVTGSALGNDSFRKTSLPTSLQATSSPPQNRSRMDSPGSVVVSTSPSGYRDSGGYYIPDYQQDQGRAQRGSYQRTSGNYQPSFRSGPLEDYRSSPQGPPHYGYQQNIQYTRGAQDFESVHHRTASRETAVPYNFMTSVPGPEGRGTQALSPALRNDAQYGQAADGYEGWYAPEKDYSSPPHQQYNEAYQSQPGPYGGAPLGQQPSNSSRDSELYARPDGRPAPPQPGRLVTEFGGRNPSQGGGTTTEGSEEVRMVGSSYPGQEWTPLGVEEGKYLWE
ncbi:FAM50 family protein [Sphaceloma murrayae]|uniref:FAM50 family protein n=1 Tax=Sphaceloma murrayae TaxID=2082308 RepID=A0A2K1QXB9_9PEZI|nr:FAM50 family protein [Sphaceloma murrayae]